jgi:hypothetical protein
MADPDYRPAHGLSTLRIQEIQPEHAGPLSPHHETKTHMHLVREQTEEQESLARLEYE